MSRPPGRWLFPLRRGVRRMVAEIRAATVREDALVLESIGPRHGAAPRASLCILAHFDPHGVVDPYVVHYVRALDALGSDVIVVSTSPRPIVSEAEKLLPYCRQVVRRRNIGLDFGSWKLGLRLVGDVRHYRRVILANDSVYGPLHPLAPLFERRSCAVPATTISR